MNLTIVSTPSVFIGLMLILEVIFNVTHFVMCRAQMGWCDLSALFYPKVGYQNSLISQTISKLLLTPFPYRVSKITVNINIGIWHKSLIISIRLYSYISSTFKPYTSHRYLSVFRKIFNYNRLLQRLYLSTSYTSTSTPALYKLFGPIYIHRFGMSVSSNPTTLCIHWIHLLHF